MMWRYCFNHHHHHGHCHQYCYHPHHIIIAAEICLHLKLQTQHGTRRHTSNARVMRMSGSMFRPSWTDRLLRFPSCSSKIRSSSASRKARKPNPVKASLQPPEPLKKGMMNLEEILMVIKAEKSVTLHVTRPCLISRITAVNFDKTICYLDILFSLMYSIILSYCWEIRLSNMSYKTLPYPTSRMKQRSWADTHTFV